MENKHMVNKQLKGRYIKYKYRTYSILLKNILQFSDKTRYYFHRNRNSTGNRGSITVKYS